MVSSATGSPGTENDSGYYQNDGDPLDYGASGAPGISWSGEKPSDGDNEKPKEQPVRKDSLPDRNKQMLKSGLEVLSTRNFGVIMHFQ
jgi:hypothetical protein